MSIWKARSFPGSLRSGENNTKFTESNIEQAETLFSLFCFIFVPVMKRLSIILLAAITAFYSCKEDEIARTSGTDTIDNTTYQSTTYYVYGFSFSEGKLVSTMSDPGPDIVIYVNQDNTPSRLTLQANNMKPSFSKVGDYPDEAAAKTAFDNLKTVSVSQWSEMADPITPNQVWIYRSGNEKYTKFRIISTVNEMRQLIAYGECTFQWVYQPDGSLTFP